MDNMENKNDNINITISKKKLLTIVGCVAALLVALVLGIVIGSSCSRNKKDTSIKVTEASKTTSEEKTTKEAETEKETETEKPTKAPKKMTLDVTYESSNTWESGSDTFNQFDFVIKNNSESKVDNWEVVMDIEDGTEVQSCWNCECKIEEGKLLLNAKEFFNATIAAGAEAKNMGVIIKSTNKKPIKGTYTESFTPDGKDSVTESTGDEEKTEPAKEEEKTEAPTKEVVSSTVPATEPGKAVSTHGKLAVKGTQLVDKNGDPYRLCGVSTHGIQWFPQYVNKDSFKYLRDDWGANVIRLAMYVEEGGYLGGGDKAKLKKLVEDGVEYATELGMYVIIDWHILNFSPDRYTNEAVTFFDEMSKKYAKYDNVIYEICNEPVGANWNSNIKPYAETVVAAIRKNDSDAVILVGTNTWSQDVDDVIGNRVKDDKNVMYVAHFYAATHTDGIRNKVQKALDAGIPIFISECSICDASGNGSVDNNQAEKWFDLLDKNNISYVCWNLCNKNETSALIASSVSGDKLSGFSVDELSVTGKWFRNRIRKDILGL